jgi:hypothetical protein
MADINPEAEKALEALTKLYPELNRFIDRTQQLNKYFNKTGKSVNDFFMDIDKTTKGLKLLGGDGIGKFARGLKQGFESINQTKEALDEFDAVIKAEKDESIKLTLEKKRETLAAKVAAETNKAIAADVAKAMSKNLVNGVANTAGSFVKGLQGNASATELSTTLMTGAIDMATGAASTAGQGISKMGDTALALGKPGSKLQIMGAAASLAGSALSAMSEGAGKLAKFGIEVLAKEVEKTVTAFNTMSASGAMFANGMTGMRNAANSAGLTVEQFSKVVQANSDSLAGSGLGVGEATRKMGQVSAELDKTVGKSGQSLRTELLKLGVSFEEQAALSAEVMADMRRGRSSQLGDNKAIAQQTAEYASSLKTIAAITGEDAKGKMQEQRRAATQVAFRLKLQELEQKQPGITQKMLASMATMDETSRTALMQQMTIGAVTDKAANVMMSGSEAYSQKINGMATLAESGAFTTEAAQRIQAEANDKMQGDLANFREIGIAGMTGALGDLNNAISGQIVNMDKVTVAAVESSQNLVAQQKSTTDTLTAQTIAAAEAAQKLKTALEETLTPAIAKFADISAKMLEAVQKQLAELGLGKGQTAGVSQDTENWKKMSVWEKMQSGAARGVETAGGIADTISFGGIGTVLGMLGTSLEQIKQERIAKETKYLKDKGYAGGGIASGPTDGFLAKLHGTEAVIPLSNGRSIPIDLSGLGAMIADAFSQKSGSTTTSAPGAMIADAFSQKSGSTTTLAPMGIGGAISKLFGSSNPTEDSATLMREHIAVLNEIKEILASSKDIQQQYVYNTYS